MAANDEDFHHKGDFIALNIPGMAMDRATVAFIACFPQVKRSQITIQNEIANLWFASNHEEIIKNSFAKNLFFWC